MSLAMPLTLAQEGEVAVIDEVIAQVNNDVITLSMVRREMREMIASLQQQGGKTEQEATEEVTRRQPELIASLIKEQLLLQQGKELGLADEVEAEVNRRMLEVAKAQGIKTVEELKKAMQGSGYDYDSVRQTMRAELMKQGVLNRDVDARIFYGLSSDELKKYFDAHKDKFKKPESVKLSEIFLSFAGKSEAEVKARADQLIAQARGGANFSELAVANSERLQNGERVALKTKGEVGLFQVTDLRDNIAAAVKGLQVGGISEPIHYDEGLQILRVDERVAGSETPVFNDTRVREVITAERSDKARVEYMEKLRKDAYIKISQTYRDLVMPFLSMTPPSPTAATTTDSSAPSANTAEKKPDTNGGKP
jgi:peptidyl-prolyl cis-trans isomerase SurA